MVVRFVPPMVRLNLIDHRKRLRVHGRVYRHCLSWWPDDDGKRRSARGLVARSAYEPIGQVIKCGTNLMNYFAHAQGQIKRWFCGYQQRKHGSQPVRLDLALQVHWLRIQVLVHQRVEIDQELK